MTNRRSEIRKKVPERIEALITYSDTVVKPRSGTVANMSRKGMFLKTDRCLAKNAYVSLKLGTEAMIGHELRAQGTVVRTEEGGVGIEFSYIEDGIERLLF